MANVCEVIIALSSAAIQDGVRDLPGSYGARAGRADRRLGGLVARPVRRAHLDVVRYAVNVGSGRSVLTRIRRDAYILAARAWTDPTVLGRDVARDPLKADQADDARGDDDGFRCWGLRRAWSRT